MKDESTAAESDRSNTYMGIRMPSLLASKPSQVVLGECEASAQAPGNNTLDMEAAACSRSLTAHAQHRSWPTCSGQQKRVRRHDRASQGSVDSCLSWTTSPPLCFAYYALALSRTSKARALHRPLPISSCHCGLLTTYYSEYSTTPPS